MLFANHTSKKKRICLIILLCILFLLVSFFSFQTIIYADDVESLYVEYIGEIGNENQQQDSENYVVKAVLKNGKTKTVRSSEVDIAVKNNVATLAYKGVEAEYFFTEQIEFVPSSDDDPDEIIILDIPKTESGQEQNNSSNTISEELDSSDTSQPDETADVSVPTEVTSNAASDAAASSGTSSAATSTEGETGGGNLPYPPNPPTPSIVTITEMVVVSPPLKTTYLQGESFDTKGLVIKVIYSNGNSKFLENMEGPKNKLMPSDKKIVMTYKYGSSVGRCDIPITVIPRTPITMTITNAPDKIDYIEDMKFDAAGMTVKIEFDNGDIVDTGYTISTPIVTFGQKQVEISYSENSTTLKETINITVVKKTPVSLAVVGTPIKQIEDISFNPANLTVKGTYDNGKTYTVTGYTYDKKILVVGEDKISFGYTENGATVMTDLDITAVKKTPVSLAVTGIPVKQIEDIPFNPANLTVKGTYDNGKTYAVTGYTFDYKLLAVGADTIPFSYTENGVTVMTELDIIAAKKTPVSLAVEGAPVKQIEDISFNPANLTVKGTYDNGKTYAVTGYTFDYKVLAVGDDSIPFSYTENGATVTTNFDITVVKKTPVSLAIEGMPVKQIEDIPFNPTNLIIKGTYDNGKSYVVTGYVFDYKMLAIGENTISFSYTENGATVTTELDIIAAKKTPVSLAIEGTPVKQIEDISFYPSGLTVKGTYDNGKSYVVTGYIYDKKLLEVGDNTIQFSYSENGETVATDLEVTAVKKTPVSIVIEGTPVKQIEDIPFNPANLTVKGTYDNGKTYDVTGYTYDKKILAVGKNTISFSYTENKKAVTTDLTITVVKKTPMSLAIEGTPVKQIEGMSFNPASLTVKSIYDNGKTYVVTGYVFDYKILTVGDDAISFSYTENGKTVTTDFNITVARRTPTAMTITSPPDKTSYIEDMAFNDSGMVVRIDFDNGAVAYTGYTISNPIVTFGQKQVEILYSENGTTLKETINITVAKKTPISLAVVGTPIKQIEDISFNPANLTVKGTYDNGKTYTVTGYTYDKKILAVGADTILFSYTENGATVRTNLTITVVKKTPVSLAVTGIPVKQIEDISFNPSGLTVKGTYDNSKTYTVTGYTYDKKILAVGTSTIPFSYSENGATVTTELDIIVVKKTPTKLNVVTLPTKTSYIEDTKFNKSGLTLSVTYDNKKTSPVSGFVIDTADLAFGQKVTTVSYAENGATVTTNVTITVAKKTPVSLAIEGTPIKQIEDISFNPANLTVKGTYDNGKTYAVTGYTYGKKVLAVGADTIPFSYSENGATVTTDLDITVMKKTPISLAIEGMPVKQIEDIPFNPTNLIIKGTYDNGKSYVVTGYVFDYKMLAVGENTIPFSYTENGATVKANLAITVAKKTPVSITIKAPPTKTVYSAGQRFRDAGMIVEATYDNGKKYNVTGCTFTDVQLVEGQSAIEISYTENLRTVTVTYNLPNPVGPQQAVYEKYACATAKCSSCNGTGKELKNCSCWGWGTPGQTDCYCDANVGCSRCNYTGKISCPTCDGTAYVPTTKTCTICSGSGKSYSRGAFVENIIADENTYPVNKRHTDGYWYVLKTLIEDLV